MRLTQEEIGELQRQFSEFDRPPTLLCNKGCGKEYMFWLGMALSLQDICGMNTPYSYAELEEFRAKSPQFADGYKAGKKMWSKSLRVMRQERPKFFPDSGVWNAAINYRYLTI
jgi:hypothetical protein